MEKVCSVVCVLACAAALAQAGVDLNGTPWTGYVGGGDPTALLVASSGGELTMASQGTFWNPDYDDVPGGDYGPFLYMSVTGNFVATTRVTGFAGTVDAQVFHNYGGIQARTPGGEVSNNEDIVQIGYFPTWTGHIAWSHNDNVREEGGFTVPIWVGDSYATGEAYPYLQLERSGDDFHFRISTDGATWIPLTEESVLYTGTETPLVRTREDMPDTLQLGLMHGMASFDPGGFIEYDFFEVRQGGYLVFSDDFSADHVFIPEPASLLLLGLGALAIRRRR